MMMVMTAGPLKNRNRNKGKMKFNNQDPAIVTFEPVELR